MRCLTLLLMIGGVVLGLSTQAGAITITMNMRDFDDGTLYSVQDGQYIGQNLLDQWDIDGDAMGPDAFGPTGGLINGVQTDTWGIFRVENIQDPNGNYIFQGSSTAEITAIFWGEQDSFLSQTTTIQVGPDGIPGTADDFPLVQQQIHGNGLQAAFFLDTTPDWATANQAGPAAWDNTTGPVDGGGNVGPVYPGITDGTLIWTMQSTSGFSQQYPTDEFFVDFDQEQAAYSSSGDLLLDMGTVDGWGTGINNWMLDSDTIPAWNNTGTALSKTVDLSLHFEATSVGAGLWLVRSSDPMEGDMVPEPVTMAGLLLGIGCLSRYVRRRR